MTLNAVREQAFALTGECRKRFCLPSGVSAHSLHGMLPTVHPYMLPPGFNSSPTLLRNFSQSALDRTCSTAAAQMKSTWPTRCPAQPHACVHIYRHSWFFDSFCIRMIQMLCSKQYPFRVDLSHCKPQINGNKCCASFQVINVCHCWPITAGDIHTVE